MRAEVMQTLCAKIIQTCMRRSLKLAGGDLSNLRAKVIQTCMRRSLKLAGGDLSNLRAKIIETCVRRAFKHQQATERVTCVSCDTLQHKTSNSAAHDLSRVSSTKFADE